MKRKTLGEVLDSIRILTNNTIEVLDGSNYKNTKSKILVNNKNCNHKQFYTTYNKIQQGLRCPTCSNIKSKNGERLTKEKLDSKLKTHIFFDDYEILNFHEYENTHKKNIRIKHKKCGNVFVTKMNNFLSNRAGCPTCRTSKIEIDVENYLLKSYLFC